MNTNIDLMIVVAKYKEDVSWTRRLSHPYTIYNKNREDDANYAHNLPNSAREGHTFLQHIIKNYNSLNEYTAFVQGNPFDHCPDTLNLLNEFDGKHKFIALGRSFCQDHHSSIDIQIEILKFSRLVPMEIKFPVYYPPGAQFLAHRDFIHNRPKDVYQKISDMLTSPDPLGRQTMWDVEKTTLQLFGCYQPEKWGL
jgi:hypothetical protein